jgi:hypothetical protein
MNTAETIEKENIPSLNFSKREVLTDPDERLKRLNDLFRSQSLGNLHQSKVKLTFEAADHHVYQVNTTIWAVGNAFVSLKGGVNIPIHSIFKID